MCFDFVDNGQTETFLVIRVTERDIVFQFTIQKRKD